MGYTAPTTRATDDLITASIWNTDLVNNISFLANPPACAVYNNAAQSIANATETSVTFNAEEYDTDTMHDNVTNNTRVTFNTAGLYVVQFQVNWVSNATGYRLAHIRLNGSVSATYDTRPAVNGDRTLQVANLIFKAAAGNYVEGRVTQNSGGALNVDTTPIVTRLAATWVGLG